MSDEVRLALVGCGGMMGSHVDHGYSKLWEHGIRDFRIVACCDTDQARAGALAQQVEALQGSRPSTTQDIESVANDRSIDAVDISVVHSQHHHVALPCLEAGKHVTIEKPLAITMRAGRQILDAAENAGVVLQVAENYRRTPEMRAVRWAIRKGYLGNLRMLFWTDIGERLWHWGWRDDVEQAGGGWSLDGGVHFADLFRFIVGEVESVYGVSESFHPWRYGRPDTLEDPISASVEDTTMAILRFENGAIGQWSHTSAAPCCGSSTRVIYGEHGALDFNAGMTTRTRKTGIDGLVQEYLATLSLEEKERLFPRGITESVATELKEFIDAVRTGGSVETDGLEGYRSLAVCMGLYESSAAARKMLISDIEDLEAEEYQRRFNALHLAG